MVNLKGGPKKYLGKEWNNSSFSIPEKFRETWKDFCKLADIDDDPDFMSYCQEVEGQSLTGRQGGRRALYIRWLIAARVGDSTAKLAEAKG